MRIQRNLILKISLGIYVSFLSQGVLALEIKEHVKCPEGNTLLLDSQEISDGIVDRCIKVVDNVGEQPDFSSMGSTEAICPAPSKELLKNNKALPKFKEKSGISVMFDYFLMRRLKFKKIAGLGRDVCVGSLPANEINKFK